MGRNGRLYTKFVLDIRKLNQFELEKNINDRNLCLKIGKHWSWLSQVRSRYTMYENTRNPIIYTHLAQRIADALEVDISELGKEYEF